MNKDRDERKLTEKIAKQNDHYEEKRTPLDEFQDQQFADDIPLEDLKIETEQEENKHKTQDDSQSERKYAADVEKAKE